MLFLFSPTPWTVALPHTGYEVGSKALAERRPRVGAVYGYRSRRASWPRRTSLHPGSTFFSLTTSTTRSPNPSRSSAWTRLERIAFGVTVRRIVLPSVYRPLFRAHLWPTGEVEVCTGWCAQASHKARYRALPIGSRHVRFITCASDYPSLGVFQGLNQLCAIAAPWVTLDSQDVNECESTLLFQLLYDLEFRAFHVNLDYHVVRHCEGSHDPTRNVCVHETTKREHWWQPRVTTPW